LLGTASQVEWRNGSSEGGCRVPPGGGFVPVSSLRKQEIRPSGAEIGTRHRDFSKTSEPKVMSSEFKPGYFIKDWQDINDQVRPTDFSGCPLPGDQERSGDTEHIFRETYQTMNIRPLYDRIVVKRVDEQENHAQRIVIPDSAKEKPQEGESWLLAMEKRLEDGKLWPSTLKQGDRILFGKILR